MMKKHHRPNTNVVHVVMFSFCLCTFATNSSKNGQMSVLCCFGKGLGSSSTFEDRETGALFAFVVLTVSVVVWKVQCVVTTCVRVFERHENLVHLCCSKKFLLHHKTVNKRTQTTPLFSNTQQLPVHNLWCTQNENVCVGLGD